jgi:cytochrome c peroxidase
MTRLIAAFGLVMMANAALAADVVVSQRNHRFDPARLSIKRGDIVHFANAENVVHHVYSDGKEFAFDSGDIPPGGEFAVTFDKVGRVIVRCAIHPPMRAEIDVTD